MEEQNVNFAKPMLVIFERYLVAFGLAMLPIIIGIKSDWYSMPLVVSNFVIQFVLATLQILPYFKIINKWKKKIQNKN